MTNSLLASETAPAQTKTVTLHAPCGFEDDPIILRNDDASLYRAKQIIDQRELDMMTDD